MDNIEQIKEDRINFLNQVYELSNGQIGVIIDGEVLGNKLGFDRDKSLSIYHYLNSERLTEPMGAGMRLSITHEGIRFVESDSKAVLGYGLAHVNNHNTINIQTMNGGAIQQATNHSTINLIASENAISEIDTFIQQLLELLKNMNEQDEVVKELYADINTIKSQKSSPKPKKTILSSSLASIKSILEGTVAGVAGTLLAPRVMELINYSSQLIQSLNH